MTLPSGRIADGNAATHSAPGAGGITASPATDAGTRMADLGAPAAADRCRTASSSAGCVRKPETWTWRTAVRQACTVGGGRAAGAARSMLTRALGAGDAMPAV